MPKSSDVTMFSGLALMNDDYVPFKESEGSIDLEEEKALRIAAKENLQVEEGVQGIVVFDTTGALVGDIYGDIDKGDCATSGGDGTNESSSEEDAPTEMPLKLD
jgi:hypothetical protein